MRPLPDARASCPAPATKSYRHRRCDKGRDAWKQRSCCRPQKRSRRAYGCQVPARAVPPPSSCSRDRRCGTDWLRHRPRYILQQDRQPASRAYRRAARCYAPAMTHRHPRWYRASLALQRPMCQGRRLQSPSPSGLWAKPRRCASRCARYRRCDRRRGRRPHRTVTAACRSGCSMPDSPQAECSPASMRRPILLRIRPRLWPRAQSCRHARRQPRASDR